MTHDERQELIRLIVEEVLRRLAATSPGGTRGRLVVALSRTVSEGSVEEVARLEEKGFVVLSVAGNPSLSAAGERLLSKFVPYRLASLPADTQAVVAPELGLTEASKLAAGLLDDAVADALWRGLVGRLPVYASPGDGFASELPRPLRRVASSQRLACERLGVRWVERAVLWERVAHALAEGSSRAESAPPARRPLVTAATVAALPEGTHELLVEPEAIVTPLARDRARQRGILLVRRPNPRGDL